MRQAHAAKTSDPKPAGDGAVSLQGIGLPVIVEDRLRNYVFVSLKLHLGAGRTPEEARAKQPYLRDALVRAGHRRPFVVEGDWTRVDEPRLCAATRAAADVLIGRGGVVRVEVVSQIPRRRTGLPQSDRLGGHATGHPA